MQERQRNWLAALGLSDAAAKEWQVQHVLAKRLKEISRRRKITHAEVAKRAGTSRTRVTAILNDDLEHVSSDLLIRILASLGYRVKVSVIRSDSYRNRRKLASRHCCACRERALDWRRIRGEASLEEVKMPLEHYPQAGFELLGDCVSIWRFMKIRTFTRLIESGNLYFSRADLLGDELEGLPLEDYVRHIIANMGPGHTFEYTWEDLKQKRQGSFVSCWTLDESLHMWEKFAPQGVAVKSASGLLKAALDGITARTMVGHVRYSLEHEGINILRFITTKRPEYFREREARALVWDLERSPQNPYPHDMPDGLSYTVDVLSLVQTVIISPHAPASVFDEVQELLRKSGYGSIPVVKSGFTRYGHLLPNVDEIARYSSK